ncbi:hypothetical protein [Kitasatospora sp. NPDC085879]|uniref:hypothetical protein n=1 Tax=Kitasatospora sp. NPDC085879 TaxID=3154769 RepID=UPI000BD6867F|nr:hypothetical protein [Streptomyces sp. TLI_235]PBC70062.1 hypothetical protein BX265_7448 [Streptomyces sp. TLI_235]
MYPVLTRTCALATAAAAVLLTTAAPAAASGRRSSDARTHNWSGPKICIAIDGHDNFGRRLTVTWTNPGSTKRATALLHEGDRQAEVHQRTTATAHGWKITAEWTDIRVARGRLCGSFTDTPNVWACTDIHTAGAYTTCPPRPAILNGTGREPSRRSTTTGGEEQQAASRNPDRGAAPQRAPGPDLRETRPGPQRAAQPARPTPSPTTSPSGHVNQVQQGAGQPTDRRGGARVDGRALAR